MEENQTSQPTPQVQEPIQPSASPPQDSTQVFHKKKRKHLPIKVKLLILVGFIAAVYFIISFSLNKINEYRQVRIDFTSVEEPVVVVEEPLPWVQWETYTNREYGFSFEYPSEARLEEASPITPDSKVFRVVFSGIRQPETVTDDASLVDGYIFRVIVNEVVLNRDVKEIANRKLQNYNQTCPEIHTSTKVSEVELDTLPGYAFSIFNCIADFEETYVLLGDTLYQITLVYRGDIGYKENYRQATKDILRTFVFLNKPPEPEEEKLKTYTNSNFKFSFDHMSLDSNCCEIAGPVIGDFTKVVVFADPENNRNGFGIYAERNSDKLTFSQYLSLQRESLIEDYRVIRGTSPQGSEAPITVDRVQGVVLKGYTWWGADLIYLPRPGTDQFLIISKIEDTPGSFESDFSDILRSFQFL